MFLFLHCFIFQALYFFRKIHCTVSYYRGHQDRLFYDALFFNFHSFQGGDFSKRNGIIAYNQVNE